MSTSTFSDAAPDAFDGLLSDRVRGIDLSGIRRVFELGAKLANPINLSIGQPDFPVDDAIKRATIAAIDGDQNGYTLTQGTAALRGAIADHLLADVGWAFPEDGPLSLLVTSGTSGALAVAVMAILNPGDELIIPDPYFVALSRVGPPVRRHGGAVRYVPGLQAHRGTSRGVHHPTHQGVAHQLTVQSLWRGAQ